MDHPTLLQSKRYRNFILERDKALERIHQHAQMDIAQLTQQFLKEVEKVTALLAMRGEVNPTVANAQFEHQTAQLISWIYPMILHRVIRLRKAVYILTFGSEAEAIGQALQQPKSIPLSKERIRQAERIPTLMDESLEKRVWFDLMKLRGRMVNAFQLSFVQELPAHEVLEKVCATFPPVQGYRRPQRVLKAFQESDDDLKKVDITTTIIDSDDWQMALDAYKDTELPPSRFDNAPTYDTETGMFKYNWELEHDLTDDFVNQVRQGQVDAAREMGIKDFVWVAVIDNKTDDCCLERSGLTTSEIENQMASGKLDSSVCDASVPPAHPNCRCQLAPVGSVNEVEGPDWKTFNEWLES